MTADPLRCPACSGVLSKPGQSRCEWCGVALPAAPAKPVPGPADLPREGERDRLAAVLEQMQSRQEFPSRSHGAGCLFFVLLLLAIAFVLFFMMAGRTIAPSATQEPPAPPLESHDAGSADPQRGQ